VRVPPIIEYNLVLHRLHPSVFTLSFVTEHDPPPRLSDQSASTNASDIDIHHTNIPYRLAHMCRRLGGVGPVFVPHSTGSVLGPIGDEMLGRVLDGGE